MTVTEMHIATRHGVDRINALRASNLLPEELDLELNKAMNRFIENRYHGNARYGTAFEESQKRIDDLRSLLVEYEALTQFKEELDPARIWVDTFRLPPNYRHLINHRTCIRLNGCEPVPFSFEGLPDISYFRFPFFSLMTASATSYVSSIRMENGSGQEALVWEPSSDLLTLGWTPNSYPQYPLQVLTDLFNNPQPGFIVLYESFGPLHFPGEVIVIVDTDLYPWFESNASLNPLSPLVGVNDANTPVTSTIPRRETQEGAQRRVPQGQTTKKTLGGKFVQQDDIFKLIKDPFNTTHPDDPLTTIRGNFIDIYTSDIFITESLKILYLREPAPISLSLGYDCELPRHTHEEIVAMTVSSILEATGDPRYQTQIREAENRE